MSSTLGIGVPVPKMLRSSSPSFPAFLGVKLTGCCTTAITGTWTLPFAGYFLFLTNRVVYHRLRNKQYLGDRLPANLPAREDGGADPLLLDTRAQGA